MNSKQKYAYAVRYRSDGHRMTEWHSSKARLQECISILKALATKYTVTKYRIVYQEVQDA